MATPNLLLVFAHPSEGEILVRNGLPAVPLGVGKVAAAAALGHRLAQDPPDHVLLVGVAGAYPERHRTAAVGFDRRGIPEIGSVQVVGEALLVDEGVMDGESFLDLEEMGLGTIGPFPADPEATRRLALMLGVTPVRAATVSTCAGDERSSALRAGRFDCVLETMESAAVFTVCGAFGVPVTEIRCVSNWTGERSQGAFALAESAEQLQRLLVDLFRSGRLQECYR